MLKASGIWVRAAARRPAATGPWDEFVPVDIGDPLPAGLLDGVDTVFHLAGRAHAELSGPQDAALHRTVNVDGTSRLLDAALAAGVERLVFLSSVKAAGEPGRSAADENLATPPLTPYGRSKRDAEGLVLAAGRSGMHVVALRPSLIYGARWKGNLQRMFVAVSAGRFPPLPQVGNRRSMVEVRDVGRAAILAAGTPRADGRVYILTDGEPYSTRRTYEAMCAAAGRPVPRWHVPLLTLRLAAGAGDVAGRLGWSTPPFDSSRLDRLLGWAWYDASRAQAELDWSPEYTLERFLDEAVKGRAPP